jgi:DNA uptake protein ComE-like DNA-binding protein
VTKRGSRAALVVATLALAIAASQRLAPSAPAVCDAPVVVATRGALAAVSCTRSGPPLEGAARLAFDLPLDVNREGARALEALPGIGAGRAAAIVAAREAAPFCDIRDLDRVPGIGLTTLARLAGTVIAGPVRGCAAPKS